MKTTILAVCLAAVMGLAQAAETRTVCIDVTGKDGKPVLDKKGKPQQQCKTMKVHKKLEGTEVPGQKK